MLFRSGYEYPRNALVNFEPINQAIDANRANALAQRKMDMEGERLGMERERLGMAKAESAEQRQMRQVQRWGQQAQVIDEMPDGPQKQALSQQFYQANPALVAHASKIGVSPQDPRFWKFLRAEAGTYDPMKQKLAEAQLAHARGEESRASAMHGPRLQSAQLELAAKQREFDNPADAIRTVKEGETLLRMPKRPGGDAEVVYGPGMGGAPSIADPKKRAEIEHTLRSEVTKLSTDYRTVRDAAASLEGIGKNDSAAGDIALIFSYMKILDPNSVVRETEFATAQNATGVPDRVRNIWNRIVSGERLNTAQRNDFLTQARAIATKQLGQYQRTLDQYKGVANRTGVDPRNVILDQELTTPGGGVATGNATIGTPLHGDEPPVMTPEQAASAPPGTWFKTTDGRIMRRK